MVDIQADHDMSPSPESHPGKATSGHPSTDAAKAVAVDAYPGPDMQGASHRPYNQLPPDQPSPARPDATKAPASNPAASATTEATTATVSQHSLNEHAHTVGQQAVQDQKLQSTAQSTDRSPPKQNATPEPASATGTVIATAGQQHGSQQRVVGTASQAPAGLNPLLPNRPSSSSADSQPPQHSDVCLTEVVTAEDGLPLSYPATLVATLPCTIPNWLAASQRTALPADSAGASMLETQILCATRTYAKSLLGADADSRVNAAASAVLTEQEPQLAASGSHTTSLLASKERTDVLLPVKALSAADTQQGLQEPDLAPLRALGASVKRPEESSSEHADTTGRGSQHTQHAGAMPAGHAKHAEVGQHSERGKRAAEEEAENAATRAGAVYKRARSDSPVAAPREGGQADRATSYQAPSDADIQARPFCCW